MSDMYGGGSNKWIEFRKQNKGLGMDEMRAKYYGVSVSEVQNLKSKTRSPTKCVRKPQASCTSPCTWKSPYTRKDNVNVKAHCRMPLRSPTGRKTIRSSPSGCRARASADCTSPCAMNKGSTYTNKKGKNITRKAYCAYRYGTMPRP